MMHKPKCSIYKVPYCFQGYPSSFKVMQDKKITNFDPIWALSDCNSSECLVYTELPRDLGLTYDQKMTKLVITPELVGKVVCSSSVTHQKVISYSWILAITRAHSLLKSTSSTTAFNCQKRSWNLSISLASDPTRKWILLQLQVFAD